MLKDFIVNCSRCLVPYDPELPLEERVRQCLLFLKSQDVPVHLVDLHQLLKKDVKAVLCLLWGILGRYLFPQGRQ